MRMEIQSFDYINFATNGYGTKDVEVFSFGLQFTDLFTRKISKYQQLNLISPEKQTLKIQWQRACLKNTTQIVLQLEFLCCKSYDNVEIRTINIIDNENRVQQIDTVYNDEWYIFANIKIDDVPGELFFEFYFYSPTPTKLRTVLSDLLKSELFSDVAIETSDGKIFNVHKNIIASNSAVFKANLVHDTQDNTSGKISSMFDAEVMTEVLGYMYSEEVNNLESVVDRLLAAADYYKLDDLKCISELYLCQHLTVDNAIECYRLADLHTALNLKEYAKRFIHINRKKIIQSAAWNQFKPTELMKELLSSFLEKS